MSVRRSRVQVQADGTGASATTASVSFSEALSGMTDATAPANNAGGGIMDQIQRIPEQYRVYFNQADLERLFDGAVAPPVADLAQMIEPSMPAPTREEVVMQDYPHFVENQGLEEIPEESEQRTYDEQQVIPANSNTALVSEATSRFSSALWYERIQQQNVILAGAGGIGSYVGFLIARMQVRTLKVYDPDEVEEGNLSGQFYSSADIGQSKVTALSEMVRTFARFYNFYSRIEYYDRNSDTEDVMICGFDNMSSRRTFYEKWKRHVNEKRSAEEKANCLFIDGRLAAEEFQVFCIQGTNVVHMQKFEANWLFSDEEAEATLCSYKQTSFCANMIASVMVNLFVNFVANKCEPLIDRALPFFTYYDATQMIFREEF